VAQLRLLPFWCFFEVMPAYLPVLASLRHWQMVLLGVNRQYGKHPLLHW
jgi:hypothetical protein